ncbi:MAG: CBS domain-containing protein [Chitinophagales bacterium]|nr:CBS domain-containing protein [Chitinophagales bacterium]HAE34815.1 hypothetical protein [Bacteroidota bacterium]MCB9021658.1 CBS domain-containing protein [Chitinophagales bacterium]MCB9031089.1 CBS domain-containing protein [Chitinophagales bacterium]HPE98445.1 CBS domain-containing protein [Chitinophagales bacterium]
MTKKILASGIMTEKVIVARLGNSFSQIMEFFTRHRIQHLPVAYDDKVLGIISVNDMLKFMADQLQNNPQISHEMLNEAFDLDKEMTHKPISVSPDTPLIDILEVLSDGKFQALPVVEGGEIKGIITNKDIVRVYHWDLTH